MEKFAKIQPNELVEILHVWWHHVFFPRQSSRLGRVGLGIIVLHLGESAQRKLPSGYGKTVCYGIDGP